MPLPIPEPARSGYTSSTAAPLYWAEWGREDAPPLLVLHGGPGASHDYLLPQMLELAGDHRVLLYDQRGGGRSRAESGDSNVTWETHVDDLDAVVSEFDLQPLSLVGYSWGALLALLYARQAFANHWPQRPSRMVLLDPAPSSTAHRRSFEAEFARRQRSEPIRSMREELQKSGLGERDRDAYRQRAFELSVAAYFSDPERARDLTPFRVVGKIQESVWQSLGEYDVTDGLEQVACPTLVVHGADDPIPLESSQAIARTLGAELVVLADCGHVPYVERPKELFDAVNRFLASTPITA